MRIRRFIAASVPDAMKKVRAALGPDAIILSTEEQRHGQVLVTAASEPADEGALAHHAGASGSDLVQNLGRALEFHRVPERLVESLLASLSGTPSGDERRKLADALSQCLALTEPDFPLSADPLMLVGMHGAGKTVTAARIAVAARLCNRPVHFVTLDSGKTGGLAQAEGLAQSLEARLTCAISPEELADALAANEDDSLVIIDTPGQNPLRPADLANLKILIDAAAAEPLLVLAAGGDALEAAETAEAFNRIGVHRMIVTKLDIARRLGSVISAVYRTNVGLCGISESPLIAEGLIALTPIDLAGRLLAVDGKEMPSWPKTEVA